MCEDGESDWEVPAVCDYRWVTARKPHKCCACDMSIRAGDKYHSATTILCRGERPERWTHCARCWFICKAIWQANGGESIEFELDCGETYEDNFGDLPEDVARLAFLLPDEAQALACQVVT